MKTECEICGTNKRLVTYYPPRCWDCLDKDPVFAGLLTERRESKLSRQDIDRLLEQSAAGVAYLREQLRSTFRLPAVSLRLR